MSRVELEATVPGFVGKIAQWPASARRLHLQHARFVPIAGELSVYCADVEAVADLLSRSKLENVRRVELFIPPGPPARLHPILDILPGTVTGLGVRGEVADAAATVAHPRFVGLRHLELRTEDRSRLTRAFVDAPRLPELESLNVGRWSSAELSTVLQRPELARLRHLGFEQVDDAAQQRALLADDLQNLEDLRDLRLREWGLGAEALALALRRSKLRSLHYEHGSSRATRYGELFQEAACRLSSLAITDELLLGGLDWMASSSLTHIEELTIRNTRLVGDAAAIALSHCELSSLRHLDLEDDDIGPPGMAAIIDRLADTLECFIGSGNPIGDDAAGKLAERDGFLDGVIVLKLERCELSAAAMRRLLDALVEKAPRLAALRVDTGNELDATCLDRLRTLQRRGVDTGSLPGTPRTLTRASRFRPSLAHERSASEQIDVSAAWKTIDRWLEEHAPQILEELAPPLNDQGRSFVAQLASRLEPLGLRVPDTLSASWDIHDGTTGDHSTFFAAVPTAPGSGWIRSMVWLGAEGTAKSHFAMLDLGIDWSISAIPIAEDGGGNLVFVDARTQEVALWDHEGGQSETVAPSFGALLAFVAEHLQAGRVYFDEDEEELMEADPLPTVPAPDSSSRGVATRLLELLVDAELVLLTADADRDDLIQALEEALAERSSERIRADLQRVLEEHDAVDDFFLDDAALERLADEFG